MPRPKNTNACKVDGCNRLAYGKGWCRPHWWRMHKYRRLEKIVGLIKGNCTIEGCSKKIKGLGLCQGHYQWFKLYGVHPKEYYDKLKFQNYVCAICEQPETTLFHNIPGKVKKLSQDHCHLTGKLRGLLCTRCNHFLGRVGEDVNLIEKMKQYIIRHQEIN